MDQEQYISSPQITESSLAHGHDRNSDYIKVITL